MRPWPTAWLLLVSCASTPSATEPSPRTVPRRAAIGADELCQVHCDRAETCGVHRDACERDCPARGRGVEKMRSDFVRLMLLCLEGAACNGLKERTAWEGCHSALVKTLPVSDALRRFCFESSRRAARCGRGDEADQTECLTRFRFANETALAQATACIDKSCALVPRCMAQALTL